MSVEKLENLKVLVEELMRSDERCRNDDKWLCYKVYRKFSPIFIDFNDFERLPAFESISRVRRKIQTTEKRLLATSNVRNNRLVNQNVFRQWSVKK